MKAALIGDHIGPSLTPLQHQQEGAALGLDYRYQRIDTGGRVLSRQDLLAILEKSAAAGFAGLNVTHPHKATIVDLMDRLEGPARDLHAVNTVVFKGSERIGYNTDYSGFRQTIIDQFGSIEGQCILQFGAGGAGAAVALALAELNVAHLVIVDPAEDRSNELCSRLVKLCPKVRITPKKATGSMPLAIFDGVVNCTPLGMSGYPGVAVDPALLSCKAWVTDIVYFPEETEFLKRAKQHGCRVVNGTSMALWQAVEAFRLITGHQPDSHRMKQALMSLLSQGRKPEEETSA